MVEILRLAESSIKGLADRIAILRMDALKHEAQVRLRGRVTLENAKRFPRPEDLVGRGAQAEAAGAAQFLSLGEVGLALPQRILRLLALGDVFAGDQHDRRAVAARHRLGVFTDPENRAVFADLADLPGVRLVHGFQAQPYALTDEVAVFLEKDVQHGLAGQLGRRVTQLCGAKRVHVEHRPGRIDHEIHDRIMLEHLAPLLHGVA